MLRYLVFLFVFTAGQSAFAGDWELKKDENGVKVFLKEYPGENGAKSFKSITFVNDSLSNVSKTIADANAMSKILHLVRESRIARADTGNWLTVLTVDMPWPVTDRILGWSVKKVSESDSEVRFECGMDNSVITASESDGLVQFLKSKGSFVLKKVEDQKTEVVWEQFNDAGGSLPTFVGNMASIDVGFESMQNLKKKLQQQNSAMAH